MHDALAAAEYALTLRRGAGQVQAESFVFARSATGLLRALLAKRQKIFKTRRTPVACPVGAGATLASAEQAYSAALARLRAAGKC